MDVELEEGIFALREVQRRYFYVFTLINEMTTSLREVVNTQHELCNYFLDVAETDKELSVSYCNFFFM